MTGKLLLVIIIIIFFNTIFFSNYKENIPNVFGDNSNFVSYTGYLNIVHGHYADSNSFYNYYLFDNSKFNRKPILLIPTDQNIINQFFELGGKNVFVHGQFVFDDSYGQVLRVDKIFPNLGAEVILDKNAYSWTDKVGIKVTAKDYNFDSHLIDKIGLDKGRIKISTQNYALDNYTLIETGTDTGTFAGHLTLTGFKHDANGDGSSDTNPRIYGTGPSDGLLPTGHSDIIKVIFRFTEDEIIEVEAPINWNVANIKWNSNNYFVGDTGIVRIIDADMNLNPFAIDSFKIKVSSGHDSFGINIFVYETTQESGVFEGKVTFVRASTEFPTQDQLRTADIDTVTARYDDNTLPPPYKPADELEVTGQVSIGNDEFIDRSGGFSFSDYNNEDISKKIGNLVYYPDKENSRPIKISHRTSLDGPIVPSIIQSKTIPISFANTNIPHSRDYFEKTFYDKNVDSLATFFSAASYGRLSIDGTVNEWKSVQYSREEYFFPNGGIRAGLLYQDVLKDVGDLFGENNRIENSNPDRIQNPPNDDIDQIVIVVARDASELNSKSAMAYGFVHPVPFQIGLEPYYTYLTYIFDFGDGYPSGNSYQKGYGILAHEMGHSFGWDHTPLLIPHGTYDDPWSLMSGKNDGAGVPSPISIHKKKTNWISNEDVIHISQGESKTFTLDFLSNASPDSNKFLMGKIPFGTMGQFYSVEARILSQHDYTPQEKGLMIYHFNPQGFGSMITNQDGVDNLAQISAKNSDNLPTSSPAGAAVRYDYSEIALDKTETFYDNENRITINFVQENSDSIQVYVANGVDAVLPTPDGSSSERSDSSSNNSRTMDELLQPPTVEFTTQNTKEGQEMSIDVTFRDEEQNIVDNVYYDIVASQNGEIILERHGELAKNGIVHHTTNPLKSDASNNDPVTIEVTVLGYDIGTFSESETFKKIVVPEFGEFSILILCSSIILLLVVRKKMGLILRNNFT